ncbi:hypothetical protein SH591_00675 [Sphingomonas sp. LY54]|uniref:hypothetical protein n=1 Tax=Sphingomonas sp. LY54 TaxID=3095343 RepID=UPI002D781323|nr:hypothetical protein [Sphingomonas sp. LY54]WRP28737.1 hypothetical protein SH591_00675 [Sphingomonas sp. LY54]
MLTIAAIIFALSSTPHVLNKAFGVSLGEPAGNMSERGFRRNKYGNGDSWVSTDDSFFDRVTVDVSKYQSLVESIAASKEYKEGGRSARQQACEADLATLGATIRSKYPSLRKPAWLKSEDGVGGMLGYYRKWVLEEPVSLEADPSPARIVSLTCFGPSVLARGEERDRRTFLFVIYRISELERAPIEADFRARERQRERDRARARALGVDPEKL